MTFNVDEAHKKYPLLEKILTKLKSSTDKKEMAIVDKV